MLLDPEYVDENTLIPQNSTVLVHRVAGHPTDAIIASPIVMNDDGMAPNKPVVIESASKSNACTETEDEETAAISTVIDAAELKWEDTSSGGGHSGGRIMSDCHYGRPLLEGETPPPGYVCRVCHVPGHFVQHCPMESKTPPPGYVCRVCHVPGHFIQHCPIERKTPPPGYICHKCGIPGHFFHHCPKYVDWNYGSKRPTCSLVPVVSLSSADGIPTELAPAMSSSVGDDLPVELHCPLCKKVMTDAVLTSRCCFDSFCDKCIRDYIVAQSKCICGIKTLADDLIPNQTLRSTITSLLSSRASGFSSGTGKPLSSIDSNLDGKSQSFIASAAMKGDKKHHMDNLPSVTPEGGHLITAGSNLADVQEKLTQSDFKSKTGESSRPSVKKTVTSADALGTVPKPRDYSESTSNRITVSEVLERKVSGGIKSKKQKKAGITVSGNSNCAEYDCSIPFDTSCYNPSFGLGGLLLGADPYMYCMPNMPYSGYPMGLYNANGISNLPPQALGMQGYLASYNSGGFPTRVHQASAHARQAESPRDAGLQSHQSERYHSSTSTCKGGSRSRTRLGSEIRDSFDCRDHHEEHHSRKKMRASPARSPRDGDQHRSRKSRYYSRRLVYDEDSSDEESNFQRTW